MGVGLDLLARLSQLGRPRYGRSLLLEGADLPRPDRVMIATRHGRVRCLRYGSAPDNGRLLHLHGGAFVTRYPQMDDFWARFVVATTGVETYLADYDVAPQARYPVAHEQVFDVAAHLAGETTLVVGGFSGGGNLAAATALWARDAGVALAGSLLGVPALDVGDDIAAKCATAPGGMITPTTLRLARETYFKDRSRRTEPWASPLRASDVAGLPPTMLVTAERDVLRAEGDAYADRLAARGVAVQHIVAPSVDHYFLHGAGERQARQLMTSMAQFVAQRVDGSGFD